MTIPIFEQLPDPSPASVPATVEWFPPDTRLSVLVVCYNHERYIREALQSVLIQEISLDFEIVIADDRSSDDTRTAAREYLTSQGFTKFRFLDHSKNIGITKNYQRALYACDADYIAIIEGDDVWTHAHKLRILLNHLHVHRECVGASANYFVNVISECRYFPRAPVEEKWSFLDARGLIHDNLIGNFSTIVYRAKTLRLLPRHLFEGATYDWLLNISLLKHGLWAFYHSPMSIYNVHAGGTWSGMTLTEQINSRIADIDRCDKVTGHVFTKDFGVLKQRLKGELAAHLSSVGGMPEAAAGFSHMSDTRSAQQRDAAMEAHERELARLAALHSTIRSAPIPLVSRIMHAVHRRIPVLLVDLIRRCLPGGVRAVVAKQMGYRK